MQGKWDDLKELYMTQQLPMSEIAKIKQCHRKTIKYHLDGQQITLRSQSLENRLAKERRNKNRWERVGFLYRDEQLSAPEISRLEHIGIKTVHNILKRLGIPKRTQSEAAKIAFLHHRRINPQAFKKGERSRFWKGGRYRDEKGYIHLYQPNYPSANKQGYVLEHRLVMERKLGRYLLPSEKVHHIDGIKDNNAESNLQLFSPADHLLREEFCQHCPLRKEIRLIRFQNRELFNQIRELNLHLMEPHGS